MPTSLVNGHLPWYLIALRGRAASVTLRACSAARADSRSHMQWYLPQDQAQDGIVVSAIHNTTEVIPPRGINVSTPGEA